MVHRSDPITVARAPPPVRGGAPAAGLRLSAPGFGSAA